MLEESEEKAFFFCHKSCLSFGPKIVKGPELHRRRLDLVWQNQMLKSQLVSGPTNKMLFSTFCSLPLLPLQGYGEQLHLLFFFGSTQIWTWKSLLFLWERHSLLTFCSQPRLLSLSLRCLAFSIEVCGISVEICSAANFWRGYTQFFHGSGNSACYVKVFACKCRPAAEYTLRHWCSQYSW